MKVCTSLQTDNHASTPLLSFFTGWMPFLPPNQQCHSTESTSTEGTVSTVTDSKLEVCMILDFSPNPPVPTPFTSIHTHSRTLCDPSKPVTVPSVPAQSHRCGVRSLPHVPKPRTLLTTCTVVELTSVGMLFFCSRTRIR